LIFSLNYSDDEFLAVTERFVAAAKAMKDDQWWWQKDGVTNQSIRRSVLRELISHRFRQR
jgi:glutamate-1-semialdehyde 2,1-aminomutase